MHAGISHVVAQPRYVVVVVVSRSLDVDNQVRRGMTNRPIKVRLNGKIRATVGMSWWAWANGR